jgi:hypothetical protein
MAIKVSELAILNHSLTLIGHLMLNHVTPAIRDVEAQSAEALVPGSALV